MDGWINGFISTSLILTKTALLVGKLGFQHLAVEQDFGLYTRVYLQKFFWYFLIDFTESMEIKIYFASIFLKI